MTTPRWAGQDTYDGFIHAAVARYGGMGLTTPLVKAIIAVESGFNPMAYRAEPARPSLPPTADFPQGGDASFGLMQLLARTARGLGYIGQLDGLFNPSINIDLGVRLLSNDLRRTGSLTDSVSAYNGGIRPSLGYGSPLASGKYANQSYVDSVLRNLDYFREWEAMKGGVGDVPAPFPVRPAAMDSGRDSPLDRTATTEAEISRTWSVPRIAVVGGLLVWAAIVGTYCAVTGGP